MCGWYQGFSALCGAIEKISLAGADVRIPCTFLVRAACRAGMRAQAQPALVPTLPSTAGSCTSPPWRTCLGQGRPVDGHSRGKQSPAELGLARSDSRASRHRGWRDGREGRTCARRCLRSSRQPSAVRPRSRLPSLGRAEKGSASSPSPLPHTRLLAAAGTSRSARRGVRALARISRTRVGSFLSAGLPLGSALLLSIVPLPSLGPPLLRSRRRHCMEHT